MDKLSLPAWLVKQCKKLGFAQPTPVQSKCVPAALQGRDIYAAAKTGSGKTAAFALPILASLAEDPYGIFAVILTPTRELAYQISDQFTALGTPIGLRVAVIVGGIDMVKQGAELSHRPHIVVATPGRLAAHLGNIGTVDLTRIRYLVLDEADRLMTNETLSEDLGVIYDACGPRRQNLLFSATLLETPTGPVAEFLKKDALRVEIEEKQKTVSELVQKYVFIPAHVRHCYLVNIMQGLDEDAGKIVFTSTCRSCEEIALLLRELGIKCVSMHSQMSQAQRLDALSKFKSSYIPVLVATDVASRGLDIPVVQYVFNFNVPKMVEDYVHRVGRTARAGRGGMAITLISEHDVDRIHAIEDHVGVKMTEYEGIKEQEVLTTMNKINGARRAANLKLMESGFDEALEKRKERAKEQRREAKRKRKLEDKAQRKTSQADQAEDESPQPDDNPADNMKHKGQSSNASQHSSPPARASSSQNVSRSSIKAKSARKTKSTPAKTPKSSSSSASASASAGKTKRRKRNKSGGGSEE